MIVEFECDGYEYLAEVELEEQTENENEGPYKGSIKNYEILVTEFYKFDGNKMFEVDADPFMDIIEKELSGRM